MTSSRRLTIGIGVVSIVTAACGCLAIPALFDATSAGEVSGVDFVAVILAVAAVLGGGSRAFLARQTRGRLFVLAAILFLVSLLTTRSVMGWITLQVAVFGALVGIAFAVSRWLKAIND